MQIVIILISLLLPQALAGAPRNDAPAVTPVFTDPLDTQLFIQNTQIPTIGGTLNSVARFSDSSLKNLKNSPVFIDDNGNVQLNGIIKNNNILSWPTTSGTAGQALQSDGMGGLIFGSVIGGGNVSTALPFANNDRIIRTDIASGTTNIQQSGVTLDNTNNITGLNSVTATSFIGNLTGHASLDVLKTGDTMTGVLAMANQNAIDFQAMLSTNFVGLQAPATIPSSYTLALPSTIPTAHQVMRANSTIPTQLEWFTGSGSVIPALSKTVYVAKFGDDVNGDGSFASPYASVSKALNVANGIATALNPIVISISAGIYTENNSAGPLIISAMGITLVGEASSATIIIPSTASQNLFLATVTTQFNTITCMSPGSSTADAVSLTAGNLTGFNNCRFISFQTGIACSGAAQRYFFNTCLFAANGTALSVSGASIECNNCVIFGISNPPGIPANTGISVTGAGSAAIINGGDCAFCTNGVSLTNNGVVLANTLGFRNNSTDVLQNGSSQLTLNSCNSNITTSSSNVKLNLSGAGAIAILEGCEFNGNSALGVPQGTCLEVTNNAQAVVNSSLLISYTNAVILGTNSDTSSTSLALESCSIQSCTYDITQNGSSTLNVEASITSGNKITVNNSTNVTLAFFDLNNNNAFTIGKLANVNTDVIRVAIDPTEPIEIAYIASLYGTNGLGFENSTTNPSTWFVESKNNAAFNSITTNRANTAALSLFSDTASPIGGTAALRGWTIAKNSTAAQLAFEYQNSDIIGQPTIPQYTVFQLDGVNNQVQLPNAATQLVFDTDTNLYRAGADVLKTDDNFIVGTLTPGTAVYTDPLTNELSSSVTTSTELGYLSGVTSPIQPQLDNKVSRSGDTMTGTLQLPAGTTAAPALTFTGSTTTGLSASSSNLSLSTGGVARFTISSGGTVAIKDAADGFTTAGIVHNDSSGNLSSTLIVNADVDPAAGIVDTKLATITTMGKVANSATTATSNNTPNTIVLRDSDGNFLANTITADLVGTVIGSASLDVLKAGDTMTGTLTMATQNAVDFQDALGVNFVGIQAPSPVTSSYTLQLPDTPPLANQHLLTGSITPTQLGWITSSGSVLPDVSNTIYVAKYGNDVSGDGSFDLPYASLAQAIEDANSLSTLATPITIDIGTGVYTENNSTGPLTITAAGISIIGASTLGVFIEPSTLSKDLLTINAETQISFVTFQASGISTASAININSGNSFVNDVRVFNFQTGINYTGAAYFHMINAALFSQNGTGLHISGTTVVCNNCAINGDGSLAGSPANTGIAVTGANTRLDFTGGTISVCQTGLHVSNTAYATLDAVTFVLNNNSIIQDSGSQLTLGGSNFAISASSTDSVLQVTGSGSYSEVIGCSFDGKSLLGTVQSSCLSVTNNAQVFFNSNSINSYTTAITVGTNTDTSSTSLIAASTTINNCTNDIIQNGSTSLNFNACIASANKIFINDTTNVHVAFFDLGDNNALTVGSLGNVDTSLIQAGVTQTTHPAINYKTSLYGADGIGFENPLVASSNWFVESQNNAALSSITTNRTNTASLQLFSDTASPFGGISALRGWTLTKNGTTAQLAFEYQNSDTIGQPAIPQYTIFQLDGVNNQVQLPTAATQLVFDTDTNLYRASADVLKTDDNFIVGTLTPGTAVYTDPVTNELSSSVTTSTELGYLSGVTSPIQTQLNNKVSRSGDTMTGALQLPAGSTAAPTLNFTGSTTTGLSASAGNLSLSTSGVERFAISSGGTVAIKDAADGFTTAGVVHNDVSGNLSSSLIVNADISNTAAITDSKLATIASAGKVANSATTATSSNAPSTIVLRDTNGNFNASTITAALIGNVTGNASGNVPIAGGTMTGTLVLPAGSAASPSLKFSGSTNTGISAPNTNTLSFDTNGSEAMNIGPTGTITINAFTPAGVVHNSNSGALSSSLIVDADITAATITNDKLATISSSNVSGDIVVRDGSGDFTTNMITIVGTTTNPTDVATKAYVDTAVSTGLVAKTPAVVVSTSNVALSGLQTIDGVTLVDGNRVLLVGQTSAIQNGLWVTHAGAWTRPTDFASGTEADEAYVLILSGTVNAGSSWLCNTPTAIIDTDPIGFAEFSLPNQTTGANVGPGAGQVFQGKTGITLNFRTIAAGTHMVVTNNSDNIALSTDATNANTPNTIVARDGSGNFSADTITATLVGNASGNLLLSGGSLTGALNMRSQNPINFYDAGNVGFVGIEAPSSVPSSYTLQWPAAAPTASQTLQAGATTPTDLAWVTQSGTVQPAISHTIYVTTYGNDVTGNGSFDQPYASLAKAISVANTLSSLATPVTISVASGTYTENNSAGPLAVTSPAISIVGAAAVSTVITPSTLSQNLLSLNAVVEISNIEFSVPIASVSTATGLAFASGLFSNIINTRIINFQTGVSCSNSASAYAFDNCFLNLNGTALAVNNTYVQCNNCNILGSNSLTGPPTNNGITATGSNTVLNLSSGTYSLCQTMLNVTGNAKIFIDGVLFELNAQDLVQSGASEATITGCSFSVSNSNTDIGISLSGAGTNAQIIGCTFDGRNLAGTTEGTGIQITNNATALVNGSSFSYFTTALQVGTNTDTASTSIIVSSSSIQSCTNDIIQSGSSTLNVNASAASDENITINDSTNVSIALFDITANNILTIGSGANVNTPLIQVYNGVDESQTLQYKTNIYGTEAMGFENDLVNPTSWFTVSASATDLIAITTDRTQNSGLMLFSDTGSPYGTTAALRGWTVSKNGAAAPLAFAYQNSDTIGQTAIPQYTVFQLDGVNNQVQLPNPATQIVFDGDTNLYRASADVLKTDDNFIVGTLTPGRAVITDPVTDQLASSVTTSTELGFLSGVTSSVQTQLNNKVSRSGDTMTGALQLPAGSAAAPSLTFTGSTTTGLSASAGNLSLNTNGTAQLGISSGGVVSINGFNTAGVVHNDASGNLSSSLIVNTDVSPTAAIVDTKLATISTAGKVANSATTATSSNTPNTIVLRDNNGTFNASTITAALIGNVTGNVTGSASNNVLKAGDTMTGTLLMASQNQIDFQAASGGNFVGIEAPNSVTSSYTLQLPATAPTANQSLRAGSVTPTQLTWVTAGGSVGPTVSETIYVTTYGNDTTGDGSFDRPYASLAKAITVANSLSSALNPITILMETGTYTENNSTGPLSITAANISIIGATLLGVYIIPTTLSNTLLTVNNTAHLENLTFTAGGVSTATAVSFTAGLFTNASNITVNGFSTGISCSGSSSVYALEGCFLNENITGLFVNNTTVQCNNCEILGSDALSGPPANSGVVATGSSTILNISGGTCGICQTGFNINSNASVTINGTIFKLNESDIIQSSAAQLTLTGTSSTFTNDGSVINIQISGAGSFATITGCTFNGNGLLGSPQGTALSVTNGASAFVNSCSIINYTTGLQVGTNTDTATTVLTVSSTSLQNCATNIIQNGLSTLKFNASLASDENISLNNSTNVSAAFFDTTDKNLFAIGSGSNVDTPILQIYNGTDESQFLRYKTNLYSTQALGFENNLASPTSLFTVSSSATDLIAITKDRTQNSALMLVSDTTAPYGGTTALRGWTVSKNGAAAQLAFEYQNSDTTGQAAIPQYTVLQLDGVNNQVQLPNAATQLVFDTDTNLYRSSASVLKTDDNFIVGTLTSGRAVITDPVTDQLASSVTTNTEVGFLSGVTSPIQTQLNNKVSRSGDTMTGTLQLPAGSNASPSLTFTGSTTTGLSASAGNLSLNTNGAEQLKISSGGTISIDGFTVAGVVHNDASGNLSTSLIVNADISPTAAITDSKLATISSSGKVANSATTATNLNTPNTIVLRDPNGNFSASTITATLIGSATSTGSFTGSLSGDVTGTQNATVVSFVGGQSAANVASATVAANAATSANTANTIVKRDANGNFAADTITATLFNGNLLGNVTGSASLNVLKAGDTMTGTLQLPAGSAAAPSVQFTGSTNTGLSAGTANTLSFDTNGVERMNIGSTGTITIDAFTSAGVIHNNTSGNLSSSLIVDSDITLGTINNNKLATISSANTPNNIVVRDANGNFSANTITATLNGNALTATTATNFSGSLSGDVTGTQSATVVSFVGGQSAANVASATVAANAATSANTPNTIVKRDGSGNFSAGTVTAALVGNVAGNATTATTATNFSGSLSGDVTGTQSATVVSFVGGQSAANVASATVAANAATSANTPNTIVKRDGSGNFSAGTVTAALVGNVTGNVIGSASLNVLKAGDTMTGTLVHPAGSAAAPSIQFTGSTNTGFSAATANTLSFDTNGVERMNIGSTGTITIDAFTTAGVIHNNTSGNLSSSLIVDSDITLGTINNNKLATISSANVAGDIVVRDGGGNFIANTITATLNGTATNFSGPLSGDVTGTQSATVVSFVGGQSAANVASATTAANAATSANTPNTIVKRDGSGNFSAGTVTAALVGNVTGNVIGSASLNVLKAGDTMTGTLVHPAGSAAAPSIQFTGSTNTGFSAATANTLSFDANGVEQMNISTTAINAIAKIIATTLFCNSSIQTASPATNATVSANANTSVLLLTPASNVTGVTINFPPTPTNGQYFTLVMGNTNTITMTLASTGNTIVGTLTGLNGNANPTSNANGFSVTYFYVSANTSWYRIYRA